MLEPEIDDSKFRQIRKFVCECLCEFYLPSGIEPNYCPFCGGQCAEFREMPKQEDIGYYEEPE